MSVRWDWPGQKSFATPKQVLPWLGSQNVASAALAGDAGRSGSCSVPGKALADDYRRHLDRVAGQRWPDCCLRPQRGRLRSAPLQAQGSPASRAPSLPQVLSGSSHQVGAGPPRPLYRSVPFWDVVGLRSCAPFAPSWLAGQEQPWSSEILFLAFQTQRGFNRGASETLARLGR